MANRKSIIDFHQIQNVPMICFISFNPIYNVKTEKYLIKACKRNTFTLLILVPWYSKNLMGIQNNLSMLREGFKKNLEFSRFSGWVGLKKSIFRFRKKKIGHSSRSSSIQRSKTTEEKKVDFKSIFRHFYAF